MVLVPSAECKLKNVGELIIEQDVCFINIRISADLQIQEVDPIAFPFGNYQPSGNLYKEIDTTISSACLHKTLDIV